MRQISLVIILLSLLSLYTCNEGDIITVTNLDFDDDISQCGETDLTFYKTIANPAQSLSLYIENLTLEELLEVDETTNILELEESGILNHRFYSSDSDLTDLFCNEVPSSGVLITDDDESDVTAIINTILTDDEDDNDGVLADIEGTTIDTDIDGILDYLDEDDDGDNVLTKDENPDPNGDGDVSDAQDTDNDGIPDYLDTDDDGDGVLTRDEENNTQNQDPTDDITDANVGADYLNPDVSLTVAATAYRAHAIYHVYDTTITLKNVSLSSIYYETLFFGALSFSSSSSISRTETPDF